mmetsp:Transcript_20446/g.27751  ORF Transcript_20446/g.27751 Transcript_20446/m.27751 type:complete len:235 (+) Transcript_20446:282-986(+)
MSSDMLLPLTGAHRIPQQLWPALMKAPRMSGIFPIIGIASGGQGRMQACVMSGVPPRRLLMVEKASVAAWTLCSSGKTSPGGYAPLRKRSGSTYSEPPMPQRYTSPLFLGYTSRCVPKRSSSPQNRAKGSTGLSLLNTILVDLIPVMGTGIRNQSCASELHGPMVTTTASVSTTSPLTFTPVTASTPSGATLVSTPSTVPMRSSAPMRTAASMSFSQSSFGAIWAPPSWSMTLL